MKIEKIFVEKRARDYPATETILGRYKDIRHIEIDRIDYIFGRTHKPYLQKRDGLHLFLGMKPDGHVKEAPPAYGTSTGRHYYFVHAYNCIYECQYCYLQGYFSSPDLVLFVNHDDIINSMQKVLDAEFEETWFHAGEFSDSLALSHLTGEWPAYWSFFEKNPGALLELRTKSTNIKSILTLKPLENIFISYSLSSEKACDEYDLKAPGLLPRLKAMQKLARAGFTLAIHLDPIIYDDNLFDDYEQLVQTIIEYVDVRQVAYISLGVVRFSSKVYHEVEKNYPGSKLLAQEFISSFDRKVRYIKPLRLRILYSIQEILIKKGFEAEKIYLCMENEDQPRVDQVR